MRNKAHGASKGAQANQLGALEYGGDALRANLIKLHICRDLRYRKKWDVQKN